MLDLAKAILDTAKVLLGLADQLKTADLQRRTDMASLFDAISACLASTTAEIHAGEIPHGRCGELMAYADALPSLAATTLGETRADALGRQLHAAHGVERLAAQIVAAPDREPHLADLEEASGHFRALANLLRAGLASAPPL
jgi:hypothetical protein